MTVSLTSREQLEVYKFNLPAAVGIPLVAVLLQAFLPVRLHFLAIFDLALLVTIFFAVARRSPVTGLLAGGAIGLLQDSLTHQPIGLYGIAKTIIGYIASSLGVKIDVENPGTRLILTFGFYLLHETIYFVIARGLVQQQDLQWRWTHVLIAALANGLLAIPLFMVLDRFKRRA